MTKRKIQFPTFLWGRGFCARSRHNIGSFVVSDVFVETVVVSHALQNNAIQFQSPQGIQLLHRVGDYRWHQVSVGDRARQQAVSKLLLVRVDHRNQNGLGLPSG